MENFFTLVVIVGAVIAYFYYRSKIVECPVCKGKVVEGGGIRQRNARTAIQTCSQ